MIFTSFHCEDTLCNICSSFYFYSSVFNQIFNLCVFFFRKHSNVISIIILITLLYLWNFINRGLVLLHCKTRHIFIEFGTWDFFLWLCGVLNSMRPCFFLFWIIGRVLSNFNLVHYLGNRKEIYRFFKVKIDLLILCLFSKILFDLNRLFIFLFDCLHL